MEGDVGQEFQKYAFSVLDIADALHSALCGTGDDLPEERLVALATWLRERVENHWHDSSNSDEWTEYENAVRRLGRAAVREAARRLPVWIALQPKAAIS